MHLALLSLGVAGFLCFAADVPRGIALAVAMLGHVGVTTNAHTWAHRSGSGSRRFDDVLAFATGNLISGIGYLFWHDKHNRRHHAAPNLAGIDPDHDFAPLIALSEHDLADRGRLAQRWYRAQWLAMPVLLALMIPRMKLEGWGFAARALRRGPRRALALLDLAVLASSTALWWGVPLLFAEWPQVLLLNVVRETMLSFALFAIFAPAHLPREAAILAAPIEGDFVLAQSETTLDYRVSRPAAFFLSGLQYQIEHHLLAGLPHVHYRALQPIVEAACRRHGYPYRVCSWGEGLRGALAVLRKPKPVSAPSRASLAMGA